MTMIADGGPEQVIFASKAETRVPASLSSALTHLTVQMTLGESYLGPNATQGIQAETPTSIGTHRRPALNPRS